MHAQTPVRELKIIPQRGPKEHMTCLIKVVKEEVSKLPNLLTVKPS